MPQQGQVKVPNQVWTEVTNGNVTSITFQCFANTPVFLKATSAAVAPTTIEGCLRYESGYGEVNKTLAALFPGVTAPVRLYAYCNSNAQIEVGHA